MDFHLSFERHVCYDIYVNLKVLRCCLNHVCEHECWYWRQFFTTLDIIYIIFRKVVIDLKMLFVSHDTWMHSPTASICRMINVMTYFQGSKGYERNTEKRLFRTTEFKTVLNWKPYHLIVLTKLNYTLSSKHCNRIK